MMSEDRLRWIEQLGARHEVIRVACLGPKYAFRVVPHGARTWRAEHRGTGCSWTPLYTVRRGPYGVPSVRQWYSPEAAMRAVENLGNEVLRPTHAMPAMPAKEHEHK